MIFTGDIAIEVVAFVKRQTGKQFKDITYIEVERSILLYFFGYSAPVKGFPIVFASVIGRFNRVTIKI